MPLSKVKSSKQEKRLLSRIKDWENIPNDIKYGKTGKPAFTKPGSNKK